MDNNENTNECQQTIEETLSPVEKKEIQKNLKEETEGKIKIKGYVKPRQDEQNRRKDLNM